MASKRPARFWLALSLVLLVDAALLLPILGSQALWLADEARIAAIARQMAASGDFVVPRIGDETYSRYPPLAFWLMALSGSALGFGEFGLRLPGALAGVGALAVVALIARRLAGERAGLAAAVVLASLPAFADEQLTCRANLLLVLFSLLAFERFLAVAAGDRRRLGIACMWVSLALAVLAKGPAGVAIPGVGVVAWLALERRPSVLLALQPGWGIPLFAALALPWYVAVAAREGSDFLWMNLFLENFAAFATGFEHARPVWFYLVRLPIIALPWIALAPLLWRVRGARGLPLALAWCGGLLLLLCLSANKRASYLSWFHPAFAIAMGIGLQALSESAPLLLRRAFGAVFGAIAAAAAVMTLGAFLPLRLPDSAERIAPLAMLVAAVAALVGAGGLWLSRRANAVASACALAFATTAGAAVWKAEFEPRLDDRSREGDAFCREIEAIVPSGEVIGIVDGLSEPGFHLYLRRALERRDGEPGVYLLSELQRDEFASRARRLEVLAARQVGHGSATLLVRVYD